MKNSLPDSHSRTSPIAQSELPAPPRPMRSPGQTPDGAGIDPVLQATDEGRRSIAAEPGPSSGSEKPPYADPSTPDFAVRFKIQETGAPLEDALVAILCHEDRAVRRVAKTNGTDSSCRLRRGSYHAAVHVPELGYGSVTTFEVAEDDIDVHLAAPFTFDMSFPVLDSDTERPISNATVRAQRSDLPPEWSLVESTALESDTNGQVRISGMTPGRWRLVVSASGYAETETNFEYPGGQRDRALSEGLITLRGFFLPALRTVHFQLVQHQSWDDLTQFSIAHTHEGEPVRFSSDGRASLTLGWFDLPLYLKVNYPDERDSVRYLDGGVPQPDEVHEIAVGGPQRLDVRLDIAGDLLEQIESSNLLLTVSYRASNDDATKVGLEVAEGGVYSFEFSDAKRVTVSIESVLDGAVTKWKATPVEMRPSGVTSVALSVDEPPLQLLVMNEKGEPVDGFNCDIRQIPNDTTWVSGATTDENGVALVARMKTGDCSLCGFKDLGTAELLVIDVPIDLGATGTTVEFPLFPTETTFLEVRTPSGPVDGVDVELVGADSGTPYFWGETGANGRTAAFELYARSRATARVLLPSHWSPTPEFDVLPGRNAVTVYDTGHLRVTDRDKLTQILSLDFDATLADWFAASNLEIDTTDGGALLCRVPIGSYEVTPIAGDPVRVDVRKGAVVPSGL